MMEMEDFSNVEFNENGVLWTGYVEFRCNDPDVVQVKEGSRGERGIITDSNKAWTLTFLGAPGGVNVARYAKFRYVLNSDHPLVGKLLTNDSTDVTLQPGEHFCTVQKVENGVAYVLQTLTFTQSEGGGALLEIYDLEYWHEIPGA